MSAPQHTCPACGHVGEPARTELYFVLGRGVRHSAECAACAYWAWLA